VCIIQTELLGVFLGAISAGVRRFVDRDGALTYTYGSVSFAGFPLGSALYSLKIPQNARDGVKESGCVFLAPHHPPAGPAISTIDFLIREKKNGGR